MNKQRVITIMVVSMLGLLVAAIYGLRNTPGVITQRAFAADKQDDVKPAIDERRCSSIQDAAKKLDSEDEQVRIRALGFLTSSYDDVQRQLTELIKLHHSTMDHSYNGKVYAIALAIGKYRVKSAVPFLVDNISFQLDRRSIPRGIKVGPETYYSMAYSLVEIGDGVVIDRVIEQIGLSTDEKTIQIDAWVIDKILNTDRATVLLSSDYQKANTNSKKENYKRVLAILANGAKLPLIYSTSTEKQSTSNKE